jgi:hypothetical protein
MDGRVNINLKETGCEDVEWIHMAQDVVRRRSIAKIVMKLRVPRKDENVLSNGTALLVSTNQEGLCSMGFLISKL